MTEDVEVEVGEEEEEEEEGDGLTGDSPPATGNTFESPTDPLVATASMAVKSLSATPPPPPPPPLAPACNLTEDETACSKALFVPALPFEPYPADASGMPLRLSARAFASSTHTSLRYCRRHQ